MGITTEAARFISMSCKHCGPLGRTLTLGRLTSYIDSDTLSELGYGLAKRPLWFEEVAIWNLGATSVDTLDYSSYEACTLVHDLNKPIPMDWHAQYDSVIDGGTLEHVFNLPVAIDNCMRLLRSGGRFFACSPANNCCGHGFYQFSPELYYRLFRADYGFEILHLRAYETRFLGAERGSRGVQYDIPDPITVGGRIMLMTWYPLQLLVCARKISNGASIIDSPPQQGDYERAWQRNRDTEATFITSPVNERTPSWKRLGRAILQVLPLKPIELRIRAFWERHAIYSLRNPRHAMVVNE